MIQSPPILRVLQPVVALLAVAWLAVCPTVAQAAPGKQQPRPGASQNQNADDVQLAEAKRLFGEGNALRKAGDYEGALSLYQQSRAQVPSVPNTLNAAICQVKLGRHDEALELYEDLLRAFHQELDDRQRRDIGRRVTRLRKKVGTIDIETTALGTVVVDGRPRGELPLARPVYVLRGRHVVRVIQEGFEGFKTAVKVKAGESRIVQVELQPLASKGHLRVEAAVPEGADVRVDGVPVGTMPWSGVVSPGKHYVTVEAGSIGSAPTRVVAKGGQTVKVTPLVGPLGPVNRVRALPNSAALSINGVALGEGFWEGRLPAGEHEISACEEGYHCASQTISGEGDALRNIELTLEADRAHPRWQGAEEGAEASAFWLELFGGVALAPSLASSAETYCDEASGSSCDLGSIPLGAMVGLRGGFEFWSGFSVVVAGGYLREGLSLSRTMPDGFVDTTGTLVTTQYELDDELLVHGPFVGAGGSYRQPLSDWLDLRADLLIGVHVGFSSDTVTGEATDGSLRAAAQVSGSGQSAFGANLMVMPGLQLNAVFSDVHLGVGLQVPILTLEGPTLELGDVAVDDAGCDPTAPSVACAPGEALVDSDRAYGTHVVFVPSLSLGYRF